MQCIVCSHLTVWQPLPAFHTSFCWFKTFGVWGVADPRTAQQPLKPNGLWVGGPLPLHLPPFSTFGGGFYTPFKIFSKSIGGSHLRDLRKALSIWEMVVSSHQAMLAMRAPSARIPSVGLAAKAISPAGKCSDRRFRDALPGTLSVDFRSPRGTSPSGRQHSNISKLDSPKGWGLPSPSSPVLLTEPAG